MKRGGEGGKRRGRGGEGGGWVEWCGGGKRAGLIWYIHTASALINFVLHQKGAAGVLKRWKKREEKRRDTRRDVREMGKLHQLLIPLSVKV